VLGVGAVSWTIGVDVGGTFTDFYAYEDGSGQVRVGKRPSTPDNPAEALLSGLRELAGQ
jgi:N-methylhydantoinase A